MVQLKIIILFFLLLLLIGCQNKVTEKEFKVLRYDFEMKSIDICNQKNMKFVGVDVQTLNNGYALCDTVSPPKIYKYQITI